MKLIYRRLTESELEATAFSPGSVYFTTDSGKLYIDPIDTTKRILIGGDGNGGASVQPDWDQTDETAPDYVKNKPDENDALELVAEMDLALPTTDENGNIYTDENGNIYTL